MTTGKVNRMLFHRRKDLAPKQTIFSEICLSGAIFLPQTLIFLYILFKFRLASTAEQGILKGDIPVKFS
ncbi:MAG: hypothetical protein MJY97_10570, partial [Bacteroidales bacterium]|nr:hypothetical protein [Bacteroidales bacterium]